MSQCTGITSNILIDCAVPLVSGTKDTLYLINQDDIASYTYADYDANGSAYPGNVTNGVISAITMNASTYAYSVQGKNNSNEPSSSLVKGTYDSGFSHDVAFRIFDNNPLIKDQISKMKNKRLVAVVENAHKGANGEVAFEIYGEICGLELTEAGRSVNDVETTGGYVLRLKTRDDQKEPNLPKSFFITDYAASKAALVALLTP